MTRSDQVVACGSEGHVKIHSDVISLGLVLSGFLLVILISLRYTLLAEIGCQRKSLSSLMTFLSSRTVFELD